LVDHLQVWLIIIVFKFGWSL